jgi:hypothetical protein
MADDKNGYPQWRMTYQDSESAARAAYGQMMLNFLRITELEQQLEMHKRELSSNDQ